MGTDLYLTQRGGRGIESKCKLSTPPGQHAKKGRKSDYGTMLAAKQMLKIMYGVLERQFRRYYFAAASSKAAQILFNIFPPTMNSLTLTGAFKNN